MYYLGIDFGLKNLGLAVSEGNLATPFKAIPVKGFKDAVDKVLEIVQKEKPLKIIVGLPEGKIGNTVLEFVKGLKNMELDVETMDETLSTRRAAAQMIELNIPKQKRQTNDDIAAAIILQNWLDER